MERKEILKRAQDEKLDERELQVKDKSMMWSYIVMVIMASVFSFFTHSGSLLLIWRKSEYTFQLHQPFPQFFQ